MVRFALVAALAACASMASAQDRRPGYGPAVNIGQAKKMAAATLAECQKNGWNVAVAVVDPHGSLIYFERMEDTQYASNDIAIGKARAAATYRRPTRVFMDAINKGSPATATGRRERRHRRPGRAVRESRRLRHVVTSSCSPARRRRHGPAAPCRSSCARSGRRSRGRRAGDSSSAPGTGSART
jgi:glc operon protein GlcG